MGVAYSHTKSGLNLDISCRQNFASDFITSELLPGTLNTKYKSCPNYFPVINALKLCPGACTIKLFTAVIYG
jgi:hypothetical protein